MKTITDRRILDDIIGQLQHNWPDSQGKAYATYDEDDVLVEASVMWQWRDYENYITIDGVRYLENTYCEKNGFSNLEIEAWFNGDPVSVDETYIENNLLLN